MQLTTSYASSFDEVTSRLKHFPIKPSNQEVTWTIQGNDRQQAAFLVIMQQTAGGTVGQEPHQQHVLHRFVHITDTSLHSLRQTFPLSPSRQHIRRIHVVFYSSETVYDRLGSLGFLHSIAHSSQPSDWGVRACKSGLQRLTSWRHGDGTTPQHPAPQLFPFIGRDTPALWGTGAA